MSRTLRLSLVTVIPILILLLPAAVFAADRAAHRDEVWRNVSVAGVELGGLGESDAEAAVRGIEQQLLDDSMVVVVNGMEFAVSPRLLGLDVPERDIVSAAMEQRRGGGFIAELQEWFRSFGDERELELVVALDDEAVETVIGDLEQQAVDSPAFQGGITIDGTDVQPDYPRTGLAIDRSVAPDLLFAAATGNGPDRVELPLVTVQPQLTDADVDAAVIEARALLASDIVLTAEEPPVEVTFTRAALARALRFETDPESPSRIDLWFDPAEIRIVVDPHRDVIEQPPVDASFVINDDETVSIVPSRMGTVLDEELVAETLYTVALSTTGVGDFPFGEGAAPDFSTTDALEMPAITKVSSATTSHPAGEPRVINIHTMADAVDRAVVWPGETFSLNEFVGRRTEEKGYVPAPMILQGELVDDIGGGVSQFATTLYNAVFFGCYEDITHTPHSRYISRYPEGREATISWGGPELIFRNDTNAVLIIDTSYTATSITVTFYGNRNGRVCTDSLSDRFNFREPDTEYEADTATPPGASRVVQSGVQGWSVTVTRTITHEDGTVIEEQDTHAYQPIPEIIRIHPCEIPEGEEGYTGEPCPIEIPSVIGLKVGDAIAVLEAAGFNLVVSAPVEVDEASAGLIALQSPGGGEYAAAGTTVSVAVGEYTPPPDEGGGEGGGDGGGGGEEGGGDGGG